MVIKGGRPVTAHVNSDFKPNPDASSYSSDPSPSALAGLFNPQGPSGTGRRRLGVHRGTIIFSEEDRPDGAFLLSSGRVKLSRLTKSGREILLDIVEPGDIFGLHEVLLGTRRTATAATLADSQIIRIGSSEIEEALKGSPGLVRGILQALLRRMVSMERRMESLMTQTVPRRLGHALLELARSEGNGHGFFVGLTHQDLGNLVGTSRETVSLFLSRFRQSGWVATERGRIRILNSKGLENWLESQEGVDEIPTEAGEERVGGRVDRRESAG
jgi:CRP-like cAMP-binding protein